MSKDWFPKLSLRKNDTTTFPAEGTSEIHPLPLYGSSWEWWQMALCVIYPMPGLLHNKGRDGNLKQCQPGNDSPPLAWVTGLARAPENSYNQLQLASVCCSMGKSKLPFLYISIKTATEIRTHKAFDQTETSRTLWPLGHGTMPLFFSFSWQVRVQIPLEITSFFLRGIK